VEILTRVKKIAAKRKKKVCVLKKGKTSTGTVDEWEFQGVLSSGRKSKNSVRGE